MILHHICVTRSDSIECIFRKIITMATNNRSCKKLFNREEALLMLMGAKDYSCSGDSSSENSEESENDEQIQENTSIDSLTGQGDEDDFIILPSSKKVKISKVKAKRIKIDYKNLQDSSKHDNENGMSTSTSTSTESLQPTSLSAAVLQTNLPPADTLTGSGSLSQPLCNHDKQPPDLQQLLP